ncbi:MAG: type II secretion system F family protein [Candidatus Saccharibacteria bacterium]|nr:type II secretion system F family protein [Microbacteriaceae bacterium]
MVAACVPLIAWTITPGGAGSRRDIRRNLARGLEGPGDAEAAPAAPLSQIGRRFVLPANRIMLDKLLALAGRPAGWPLPRVLLAKPALAVVATVLGLLFLSAAPGGAVVVMVIGIVLVAYFVPDLLLYSRGTERQTTIGRELPDTLDQMLIAVEAGMGFEAAMSRAGQNGKGPLAEELVRTLQDIRVGMSRRDAYLALSVRTSSPDLRAFIRAVIQADVYGISVRTVLRTQAKEMRIKRRQRAEEKAMQIPVKVLFPLMLLILPVLFIAVLGPTVITIMGNF